LWTSATASKNTISGTCVVFKINPDVAAAQGFSPEEVATDAAAMLGASLRPRPLSRTTALHTAAWRFS